MTTPKTQKPAGYDGTDAAWAAPAGRRQYEMRQDQACARFAFEAVSDEDAYEYACEHIADGFDLDDIARANGGKFLSTEFFTGALYGEGPDGDMEFLRSVTEAVEPPEPDCTDGGDHDWREECQGWASPAAHADCGHLCL